jgi:hypothetical protein
MKILLFDMGLPMILPSAVLMTIGLVPIVIIESIIVAHRLQINFRDAITSQAVANLVSTLIGIPLTWFLLTIIEFMAGNVLGNVSIGAFWSGMTSMTVGAAWIVPGQKNEEWIILGAMLFLLIPYGLASWMIEYFIVRSWTGHLPAEKLRSAVGLANLASYCLLAISVLVIFFVSRVSSR